MTDYLNFLIIQIQGCLGLINQASFDLYGHTVTYLDVVMAFFFIFFVVTVFWRGSRA